MTIRRQLNYGACKIRLLYIFTAYIWAAVDWVASIDNAEISVSSGGSHVCLGLLPNDALDNLY